VVSFPQAVPCIDGKTVPHDCAGSNQHPHLGAAQQRQSRREIVIQALSAIVCRDKEFRSHHLLCIVANLPRVQRKPEEATRISQRILFMENRKRFINLRRDLSIRIYVIPPLKKETLTRQESSVWVPDDVDPDRPITRRIR
jgi:hypothetical protein